MARTLSLHEVLDVAQTMEGNGADFYRQAAKLRGASGEKEMLLGLARMEEDHKKAFAEMQQALPRKPFADQSGDDIFADAGLFLSAILDADNLEGSRFARHIFTGEETVASVVLMGADLEKETILYYLGMRDLFASAADKKIIDKIISEEKAHLATLLNEYRKLEKQGG